MDESFLKKVFSTVKCGVCGQKYQVFDVKVINQEDNLWFLSASCSHCQTKGLIVAVIEDSKAVEFVTDLKENEFNKFAQCEVVCSDDVVNMHNFLREFDGDFVALFSEA